MRLVNNLDRPIRETNIGAALVSSITPAKTSTKPSRIKENSSGVILLLIGSIPAIPIVQSSSSPPSQAKVLRLACRASRDQIPPLARNIIGNSQVKIGVSVKMTNTPPIVHNR